MNVGNSCDSTGLSLSLSRCKEGRGKEAEAEAVAVVRSIGEEERRGGGAHARG